MLSTTNPQTSKLGKIIIMRHAETNYNYPRKRLQGMSPSDKIHISEKGRQEATSKLASITLPDLLIMSPLLRCKQTAEAWAGNDLAKINGQIKLMDGLKEVDAGELEDFYVDELEKHEKYGSTWQLWKKDPLNFPGFPNGETLNAFQARVLHAFADICKEYMLNPTLDICVITHGGPMRILKCFLANKDLSHLWDGQDIANLERLELTSDQILQLINQREKINMLKHPSHKYIECKYDKDHWALDNTKEGTCIAFIKFRDKYNYAIKLNPTDRRGYRALITYTGDDKSDIQTTFNRQYTIAEQHGLSDVTTLMIEIYKKLGLPIVQTAQAGNNSHSLLPSGMTQIGNEKEPSMLHTHIWGRGNPAQEYISGIPLDGPKPGEMFDMMAKTPNVPGNQKKIKWEPQQLETALLLIKNTLHDYTRSEEFQQEFGDTLTINIYQPEKLFEKSAVSLSEGAALFAQQNDAVRYTRCS